MSDTPRVDAWEKETVKRKASEHAYYGWKRARRLERELNNALQAVDDDALLDEMVSQHERETDCP